MTGGSQLQRSHPSLKFSLKSSPNSTTAVARLNRLRQKQKDTSVLRLNWFRLFWNNFLLCYYMNAWSLKCTPMNTNFVEDNFFVGLGSTLMLISLNWCRCVLCQRWMMMWKYAFLRSVEVNYFYSMYRIQRFSILIHKSVIWILI